jgi:hypothetical protein
VITWRGFRALLRARTRDQAEAATPAGAMTRRWRAPHPLPRAVLNQNLARGVERLQGDARLRTEVLLLKRFGVSTS